jgi:hypothetical protein
VARPNPSDYEKEKEFESTSRAEGLLAKLISVKISPQIRDWEISEQRHRQKLHDNSDQSHQPF